MSLSWLQTDALSLASTLKSALVLVLHLVRHQCAQRIDTNHGVPLRHKSVNLPVMFCFRRRLQCAGHASVLSKSTGHCSFLRGFSRQRWHTVWEHFYQVGGNHLQISHAGLSSILVLFTDWEYPIMFSLSFSEQRMGWKSTRNFWNNSLHCWVQQQLWYIFMAMQGI